METMRSNSSNKASANKDPGIYTCPTCNALFTCLKFYQQHVSQHAEANGTKLFCCNRCRYSTDSSFQYNWHQMSHKNTPPHSCSVCQDKSVVDSYNSNNHLNGREDSVATGKSPRKAQQNGNSNKRVKYSNSKVKQEPYVKQEESDDEDDEEEESDEGESDTEENDDEENENEEDDEEASDSEEEESEEDEDEMDKDVDHSQANVTTYELASINQGEEDEEMSDEDDDEESEIESEEDNGENNDVPDEYLVSQRLNRQEGDSTDYHYDMQNANAHVSNNNNSSANKASDAYATTINVADLPELAVNDGIIINNKGKGKGNRKSRTINQMGGQVDDEMSQLRRKFHCSHCGKSFKTKSHLQRHILTHTGEKPYHCNRCGAKFNQSSSLRNHIIALHTKEYPHFCNHCNKGFLMPALLQKHLQTSHRDQD